MLIKGWIGREGANTGLTLRTQQKDESMRSIPQGGSLRPQQSLRRLAIWAGLVGLVSSAMADDYDAFFTVRIPAGDGKATVESKPKDDRPVFADVVAGADTLKGLFTLYHMPTTDQLWLEILPGQLGQDFLMSFTQETGAGAQGLLSGLPAEHMVVRFDMTGERVRLTRRNLMFRAVGEGPVREMVERSVSEHPLVAFKLASKPEPERGSCLVLLNDWLLGDPLGTAQDLKRSLGADYAQVDGSARWSMAEAYPENVELGMRSGWGTSKPSGGWSVMEDPRRLELELRASLSRLPLEPFPVRLSDPRVGYFETGWRLWGDDQLEDPMIRVANRWRLEKKDPGAALSEPVKPIVYWMENTIPMAYRDAVRRGAELWNTAFEQAGFRNAFVVKQMPDTAQWDPADIRYNTIRWISSNEPSFGAMGPSQVNPWTGEILNADILIEADMVRRVAWGWRSAVAPLGRNSLGTGALLDAQTLPEAGDGLLAALEEQGRQQAASWADPEQNLAGTAFPCLAASQLAEGAWAAAAPLAASGELKAGDPLPWPYVEQYLVSLVSHEVGHTLGLRHNFAASALHDFNQLWDSTLTARTGLVGSVMEYDPACVALDRSSQGDYYTRVLGPYDLFAIQWGYTPTGKATPREDALALQPLLARSATEAGLRYGTDEDAYDVRGWGSAVDPTIRVFDLSSQEEPWTRHQLALARAQLQTLPASVLKEGDDPLLYRRAWERAFGAYWGALQPLSRYVGALRFSRQPWLGKAEPLSPWPVEEQERLIRLLLDAALDPTPWLGAEERLATCGPGFGWSFDGSRHTGRQDMALREMLARQRGWLLAELYCPKRLSRAAELEARKPAKGMALESLFREIRTRVWRSPALSLEERDVQRQHAGLLMELLLDERLGELPDDARLLARADLEAIRAQLALWRKAGSSGLRALHEKDLDERIALALARERDRL